MGQAAAKALTLSLVGLVAARTGPWAAKARKPIEVPNCTTAVAAAVARPSACVPDGWVVLSMTNTHHAPLQRLQYERVAHLGCFMTRVVSLCYGSVPDAFGACVYGPHVIASDYRRSQYVSLNWAKWPFFLDAFRAARHLLWIEADVLIMRNPFEVLLDGGEREKTLGDAIRYQGERAPCDAYPSSPVVQCGAGWVQHEEPLNCGQLVINSPHLAQTIYDARPDNFTNGAFSQQHYANVHKVKYAHSPLPVEFYSYHWSIGRAGRARIRDPCGLVTYQ